LYYNDGIKQRQSNPKELWKFIKTVIPNKRSQNQHTLSNLEKDGKNFKDPADIFEQFNNYFVEIGQSIANT